jgi:spermidine synthase
MLVAAGGAEDVLVHHPEEAAGFTVKPYQTAVPSFMSVWGFGLARLEKFDVPCRVPEGVELRFLNNSIMPSLFELSADLQPVAVEINRLDNQPLVHYHETEWKRLE